VSVEFSVLMFFCFGWLVLDVVFMAVREARNVRERTVQHQQLNETVMNVIGRCVMLCGDFRRFPLHVLWVQYCMFLCMFQKFPSAEGMTSVNMG
jgi:hypothetical protein